VQVEHGVAGRPVQPQGEGADGDVHRAAGRVARVADGGAQRQGVEQAEVVGRVLVRARLTDVDAVEVVARAEVEPRLGQVRRQQAVGGPVGEHGG
jgi:hypothetical protein